MSRTVSVFALSMLLAARVFGQATNDWSQGVVYEYDGSGNIKKIGTDPYVYDTAQRLVRGSVGGSQQSYTYDAFGNRTGCDQSGGDCQYGWDIDSATNRVVGRTYDARGNMLQLPEGNLLHYDDLGMPRMEETSTGRVYYIYTADDERIAVYESDGAVNTWRWTIRGLDKKPLREFTSDNTGNIGIGNFEWSKDYVWRDGSLLASRQADADETGGVSTYHYHVDHLGTPRQVTNAAGTIIGRHDYLPFGPELTTSLTEPVTQNVKFTGHERDSVGARPPLDYMHARYYEGRLGRFLSVDPIMPVEAMRSPQLWNRYSYVGNNPMNRIDPTGKLLQFFGSAADLEKVKQIANSGLHGYKLNINDKGVASLEKVKVKGSETSEQKALRGALQQVIGDKGTTSISVASGAKGVVIGQFNMKTIDPTDMQKFGSAQPSAASTLGHEVLEQYAGQVGNIAMAAAHAWASQKESALTGWTRGGQTPTKWLPNGQAYSDVRYTRGNESMDVRVTVNPATYDVTSVTRIPVP